MVFGVSKWWFFLATIISPEHLQQVNRKGAPPMVHACDAVQEKSLAVILPALKEAPYILFANQNYAGISRDAG